jgi:uncharacterized lipoprotein YajG
MGSSQQHIGKRASSAAAVLVAGAVVLMAGCQPTSSSAGANPSASPSASPAAGPAVPCSAVTSLRTALANLSHIKPTAAASGQIAADLTAIKTQLEALKTSAAANVAQDRSLNQAIDRLSVAASAAASHPTSATIAALATALGDVTTSVQPLIADLNAACPSP